jgi:hypothetical protein
MEQKNLKTIRISFPYYFISSHTILGKFQTGATVPLAV